jgi:hypothetical protein
MYVYVLETPQLVLLLPILLFLQHVPGNLLPPGRRVQRTLPSLAGYIQLQLITIYRIFTYSAGQIRKEQWAVPKKGLPALYHDTRYKQQT